MSAALYQTGLWWTPGCGGQAKLRGHAVPLTEPPVIGPDPVYLLTFEPAVHVRWVHFVGQPPRDMRDDEVEAANRLLARLCAPSLPG